MGKKDGEARLEIAAEDLSGGGSDDGDDMMMMMMLVAVTMNTVL